MSRIFKIGKICRIRETGLQVRKDLNLFFASGATLVIKVLTDLENRHNTDSIDI